MLMILFAACQKESKEQKYQTMVQTGGGDAKHGRQLIDQYGCTSCHSIPTIEGPKGMVGPPLDHIATRTYIAGKFPNNPETMTKWLQNPQAMDPANAMPNLGITPADSRDLTAFLYTLK
jgi:cytochrome c